LIVVVVAVVAVIAVVAVVLDDQLINDLKTAVYI
jgi:hypothetical protein